MSAVKKLPRVDGIYCGREAALKLLDGKSVRLPTADFFLALFPCSTVPDNEYLIVLDGEVVFRGLADIDIDSLPVRDSEST